MKILAQDRQAAKQYNVSAYRCAQARELGELAESNHQLAREAERASRAIFDGSLSMAEGYKLVKKAMGGGERALLSAQIDADLLQELKTLAQERKQLFRDLVEEMVTAHLKASRRHY